MPNFKDVANLAKLSCKNVMLIVISAIIIAYAWILPFPYNIIISLIVLGHLLLIYFLPKPSILFNLSDEGILSEIIKRNIKFRK